MSYNTLADFIMVKLRLARLKAILQNAIMDKNSAQLKAHLSFSRKLNYIYKEMQTNP